MICPSCRNDVEPRWEDEGIGPYEFWGQRGVDTQMVARCPECGEELEIEQSYEDSIADLREDENMEKHYEDVYHDLDSN